MIVNRLRATRKILESRRSPDFHNTGKRFSVYHEELINPDGPEAADEIERLTAERDALRAQLAAEREQLRLTNIDWFTAEADRDALRALLGEAIQHVSIHHSTLRWQIYLALKGNDRE